MRYQLLVVTLVLGGCSASPEPWRDMDEVTPATFDLDQTLAGKRCDLPGIDTFGRRIPSGTKIVVAMPSCESCAAKTVREHGGKLLLAKLPVVLCYPDAAHIIKRRSNPVPGSYTVSDLRQQKVPDAAYLFSPRALRVDGRGAITGHLGLDAKPDQWRKWTR